MSTTNALVSKKGFYYEVVPVSAGERKQQSAMIKLCSRTWLNLRKLVDSLHVHCCRSEEGRPVGLMAELRKPKGLMNREGLAEHLSVKQE